MTSRMQTLKDQGNQLFGKRSGLLSLWQCIAENFHPVRADFTTTRNLGDDYAAHLMSSYPVIACRDLSNSIGTMLDLSKFSMATNRPDKEDTEAKQWLEWATGLMKNAMYARPAMLKRALKEGDSDIAPFGQCATSVELNRERSDLLYRTWHLRDVAWCEDDEGKLTTVYRKHKLRVCDLVRMFPKTVDAKVREKLAKEPHHEVQCWHVVIPNERYQDMAGAQKMRQPFVSIHLDVDHDCEMEAVGAWEMPYNIPRWQTMSGSQYAYSPAIMTALADARLIQQMTLTVLEAGEKAVTPPMIGVSDAIRGDMNLMAGGFTAVAAEYDERLGEVLRPLSIDKSGLPFGLDMIQDLRHQIADALLANRLNLPPVGVGDMTATEVAQRVQEFVRNAMPLVDPLEVERNASLCELTFSTMLRAGAFGRPETIPKSIQGSDVEFQFDSPLKAAEKRVKVTQFMEAQQIIANAAQLDPSITLLIDGRKAAREALSSISPAEWQRSEADVEAKIEEQKQAQMAQQAIAAMSQGADIAKTIGETRPAGTL
jgi:hypothetical protein